MNRFLYTLLGKLLAILSLSSIISCGGGGGGGDGGDGGGGAEPLPIPNLTAKQLQGRWISSSSNGPTRVLYVIPTPSGSTAEGWMLTSDGLVGEYWGVTTTDKSSLSVVSKRYNLGVDQDPTKGFFTGNAILDPSSTLTIDNQTYIRTGTLEITASVSSITGKWSASAGGGAIRQTFSVNSQGVLSGTSTSGCAYNGTLSARDNIAVFAFGLTESCGSGPFESIRSFSGIANYISAEVNNPARLLLVSTTSKGSDRALVISAVFSGGLP
jgi:hypothetical protein